MEYFAKFIWPAIWSIIPIAELRGGIPVAILIEKIPFWQAFIFCVIVNSLATPIVYVFLSSLHKLLIKWNFYKNLFDKFVERTRKKVHEPVEKYGWIGIAVFVAIPLPITGAYTGALGSWLLGLSFPRALLACTLGVVVAGIVVTAVVLAGEPAVGFIYRLFVKPI